MVAAASAGSDEFTIGMVGPISSSSSNVTRSSSSSARVLSSSTGGSQPAQICVKPLFGPTCDQSAVDGLNHLICTAAVDDLLATLTIQCTTSAPVVESGLTLSAELRHPESPIVDGLPTQRTGLLADVLGRPVLVEALA